MQPRISPQGAHFDRMDSSMAPPHFCSSRIQAQYSALGRSRKASVKVSGSSATVRAVSALLRGSI